MLIDPPPLFLSAPFPCSLSLPLSFPYPSCFPRSLPSSPFLSHFPTPHPSLTPSLPSSLVSLPPSFPHSLSPFLSHFPTPHPSLAPSLPPFSPLPQPPRDVHPVVWFSTVDTPPLLVENFPFDKYELEPSPLTQYILAKKNPHICWQVCTERGVVIMP